MKILIVSQYFWPEPFRINDLSCELAKRGHEVSVLTGQPNYPDGTLYKAYLRNPGKFNRLEKINIIRIPLIPRKKGVFWLTLNYLSFALFASTLGAWKLRKSDFDVIFICQLSPVLIALPAIIIGYMKKKPIAMWVLDLWPQTLKAMSIVQSEKVLNFLEKGVHWIYRQCALLFAQSQSFIEPIKKGARATTPIIFCPSWSEEKSLKEETAPAPEIPIRKDIFTIVFTGNIGQAQDFPAIVAAAEHLKDEPLRWIIIGDGRKAEWLKHEIKKQDLSQIMLMPGRFELERMASFYAHADALLVSLEKSEAFAMTIPGKLQSYLAEGKPILAMLDGEGAKLIEDHKAGLTCPSGASQKLVTNIKKMMTMSKEEHAQIGANGKKLSQTLFNRKRCIDLIERNLKTLTSPPRADL